MTCIWSQMLLVMSVLLFEILYLLEYLTRAFQRGGLHQTTTPTYRSTLILWLFSINNRRLLLLSGYYDPSLTLLYYTLCKVRIPFDAMLLHRNRRCRVLWGYDFKIFLLNFLRTQGRGDIIDRGLSAVSLGGLVLLQVYRGGWGGFRLTGGMGALKDHRVFWGFSWTTCCCCCLDWDRACFLFFWRLRDTNIAWWRLIRKWSICSAMMHRLHPTRRKLLF